MKMFLTKIICLFLFCILCKIEGKPQNLELTGNCLSFENEGYRCVDLGECSTSECRDFKNGKGGKMCSEDENSRIDYLEILSCGHIVKAGLEPSVCCHNSSILSSSPTNPSSTVTTENCFSFKSDGYSCVSANQCRTVHCETGERGKRAINDDCSEEKVQYLKLDCDVTPKSVFETSVCCHDDSIGENLPDLIPKCGAHVIQGYAPRIFGISSDTSFGEWPHMCALFQDEKFIGGASLIAPGVVLTAAHIVQDLDVDSVMVRCGDWDIKSKTKEELLEYQELHLKEIIKHPRFEPDILTNDIAILYTKEDFNLTNTIIPICLPSGSELSEIDMNKRCIATGWGESSAPNAEASSGKMKYVELPLVDKEACEKALARDGSSYHLHDSMICAGGVKDEDTCKGDGGGPLVCRRKTFAGEGEVYVQVGITSFGRDCGKENLPGIYASVGSNLCFIDAITECLLGKTYQEFFNYRKDCKDWVNEEAEKINAWVLEAENKVAELSTDNSLRKKLAEKNVQKAKKSQENFKKITYDVCGKK